MRGHARPGTVPTRPAPACSPAARPLPKMKALGKPLTGSVVEMSYLDLQRIDDSPQGHAFRRYMKGHYLRQLSDEAIEALVQSRTNGPAAGRPSVGFQAYGGAIAEVPDGDSAFTFLYNAFEYVSSTRWSDPAEDASRMARARRTASAIAPIARGE